MTRDGALRRLGEFLPLLSGYGALRNYDDPGRENVSLLSAFVARRLILEEEILRAALREHSFAAIEKFFQEVCWRTYWKGWLELRPQVLERYLRELAVQKSSLRSDEQELYRRAVGGETGIECFDVWSNELRKNHYLHNHVRMWFASIWIFTLKLPWQLGAEYFFQQLLDADAASNTLSWRWVAGLHTAGKHYVAKAENIRKYTRGRFDPKNQLNEDAGPVSEEAFEYSEHRAEQKIGFSRELPVGRVGWLLSGEDLCPEIQAPEGLKIVAVAGGWDVGIEKQFGISAEVVRASEGAFVDALNRAARSFDCSSTGFDPLDFAGSVRRWADREELDGIVFYLPAVGPWRQRFFDSLPLLTGELKICALRREWDRLCHPHASAGYFRFRKCFPELRKYLDLSSWPGKAPEQD